MDFSQALNYAKAGSRIARSGWNGKGLYVELQKTDENSKMGHPYLYIKTVEDKLVPWTPSQTDLLANDWSAPIKQ